LKERTNDGHFIHHNSLERGRRRTVPGERIFASCKVWSGCGGRRREVKRVDVEKLANVPGKSITAVVVNYAPGRKSGKHQHAGSVLAYVLSGAIRSENSATGPVRVYKAGESFFEPPGSEHLVSENASATEPASLLAVFVAMTARRLPPLRSERRRAAARWSTLRTIVSFLGGSDQGETLSLNESKLPIAFRRLRLAWPVPGLSD
jgi:quercetin dioxygenase-like cupin family protein